MDLFPASFLWLLDETPIPEALLALAVSLLSLPLI